MNTEIVINSENVTNVTLCSNLVILSGDRPTSPTSDTAVARRGIIFVEPDEEEENDRLYGDDPCYQHYKAGQYDCPKCRVMSDETIAEINIQNCMLFMIDRIVDEETNAIKENECPICMDQMTDPEVAPTNCKDRKIGNNCEHQHCFECFVSLVNSSNQCSICRQILIGGNWEMPLLTDDDSSEEEEEQQCLVCGSWGLEFEMNNGLCVDCADGLPHICEMCGVGGATIRPHRQDEEFPNPCYLCDDCEDGH